MTLRKPRFWMVVLLGLFVLPGAAWAAACGCTTTTPTPPAHTNCCKPPTPPSPPSTPCCGGGSNIITVPGVNVYVAPTVIVNASAVAVVNASASASASASGSGTATGTGTGNGTGNGTGTGNGSGNGSGTGTTTVNNSGGGGGGSSWFESGGSSGYIQSLNVELTPVGGLALQKTAYQATRTKVRIVVIQAVCLDDKDVPHPASQVTPDKELPENYEGEVYRCIAGARMQWTLADYSGKVEFGNGQTITCNKSEALVLDRSSGPGPGKLECRPQKAARDCNERSLLRRFGAGVKILKIVTTETYTAYREEQVQSASVSTTASSFNMSIDGGVGGVAH